MDDALFPESRIYPEVLDRLTPAERLVLRYVLSRRSSSASPPIPKDVFNGAVRRLLSKLGVRTTAELILLTVKGDPAPTPAEPHAGQPPQSQGS